MNDKIETRVFVVDVSDVPTKDVDSYVTDFANKINESKRMTRNQADEILNCCDIEGFDCVFNNRITFDEILDEEFQKLRKSYIESYKKLENRLRTICPDHEEC